MRRLVLFVGLPVVLGLLMVGLVDRLTGAVASPGPAPGDSTSGPTPAAGAGRPEPGAPATSPATRDGTASPSPATGSPAGAQAPGVTRLELSFKLDPRVTRSLHMGDRWVSPPTYTSTGGPEHVSVDVRARPIGGAAALPAWTASEPDMVEVSPPAGEQVRITVRRAGVSRLTVSSGGASRTLLVEASELSGGLRLDLSQ